MLTTRDRSKVGNGKGPDSVIAERRGAQRFRVHWEASVRGIDSSARIIDETARLSNLSSTGASINLSRRLDLGARLSIRIAIPFKKRSFIGYSAIVVRVEEANRCFKAALEFDNSRPSFVEN